MDEKYIEDSIAVDASCIGNPGPVEWKGIHVKTGKVIFSSKVYPGGTNNIGEFLAIVHALAYCKKHNIPKTVPIYSDSQTAIAWVKHGRCNTVYPETKHNKVLFDVIRRANVYLQDNRYTSRNPVLKWDTREWGEIGEDYGRKV